MCYDIMIDRAYHLQHVLSVLRPLSVETPTGVYGWSPLTLPPLTKPQDAKGTSGLDPRRIASTGEVPSASTRKAGPRVAPPASTLLVHQMLRDLPTATTIIALYKNSRSRSNVWRRGHRHVRRQCYPFVITRNLSPVRTNFSGS